MSSESRFLITLDDATRNITRVERIGEAGELTEIGPASFMSGVAGFDAPEPVATAGIRTPLVPLGAFFPHAGPISGEAESSNCRNG